MVSRIHPWGMGMVLAVVSVMYEEVVVSRSTYPIPLPGCRG
jgi:hypothetical protein